MTILESQPTDRVKIKLEFIRPFADTANTDFTFKPQGDQTAVTWSMTCCSPAMRSMLMTAGGPEVG